MQTKKEALEVYTPEFFLSPEPLYAQLRASEPVCRVKLPRGIEGWWITRYEDVEAALKVCVMILPPTARQVVGPERISSSEASKFVEASHCC